MSGGRILTIKKVLICLFILGSFSEFYDFLIFIVTKLEIIKFLVGTVSLNKLGMCTFLDNGSTIK